MMDADVRKLIRSLRESLATFRHNATYAIPAMDGFIRRHQSELVKAIEVLEDHINEHVN